MGYVVDAAEGQAIAGAQVFVCPEDRRGHAVRARCVGGTTDTTGLVVVRSIPVDARRLQLSVRRIGYGAYHQLFRTRAEQVDTLAVRLQPKPQQIVY